MKESLTPLRVFLAVIAVLALLNIGIVFQLKGAEGQEPSSTRVMFTLLFVTLSVVSGVLLAIASWQAPRLIATAPKFIKAAILLRYALLLVERTPFALSGDFLSISLLLLWTGVSFYMVKAVDRHHAAAKSEA